MVNINLPARQDLGRAHRPGKPAGPRFLDPRPESVQNGPHLTKRGLAPPDRAADRDDLAAGKTLPMPVLVLASEDYLDKDKPETALAAWRRTFAPQAQGGSIASGHFMAEEAPEATLRALRAFLTA